MDLEVVICEVCGEALHLRQCVYCGRFVCGKCSPDSAEPCRGCFELDDAVEVVPRAGGPREKPTAKAQATASRSPVPTSMTGPCVVCDPQRSTLAFLRAFADVADLIGRQNAAGDPPKVGVN